MNNMRPNGFMNFPLFMESLYLLDSKFFSFRNI